MSDQLLAEDVQVKAGEATKPEVQPESRKVRAVTAQAPAPASVPSVPTVPNQVMSPQMKQILADQVTARKAQARRLETPDVSVGGTDTIPQKEIMRRCVPEAYGPNPTMYAKFGDKKKYKTALAKGYEPCFDENGVIIYGDSEDVLLKIPIELHRRELKKASAKSDRNLGDLDRKQSVIPGALTETLERIDPSDVTRREQAMAEVRAAVARVGPARSG